MYFHLWALYPIVSKNVEVKALRMPLLPRSSSIYDDNGLAGGIHSITNHHVVTLSNSFLNKKKENIGMEVIIEPCHNHRSFLKKLKKGRKSEYIQLDRKQYNSIILAFPINTSTQSINECFMDLALEQAQIAGDMNEVPIGAVAVQLVDIDTYFNQSKPIYHMKQYISTKQDKKYEKKNPKKYFELLATSHNQVETLYDASAHAEILTLRQAAVAKQLQKNWRLYPNVTLYSTLEPCPMCLSAIQAFRVQNVVYGARDIRLGACTSESYINLLQTFEQNKHPYHPTGGVIVEGGVREELCGNMLRFFFQRRRKERKKMKLVDEQENNHNKSRHASSLLLYFQKWKNKFS